MEDGDDRRPTIAIVGGHGGMGSWIGRHLTHYARQTLISDRGTHLSNQDVASVADIVIIAIPLRDTPRVLAEVSAWMRPQSLLMSLGSLMEPAASALVSRAGNTLLLHPLFGPAMPMGERVSFGAARLSDGTWSTWMLETLRTEGATIIETTPLDHDRTMAFAQGLLHGQYVASLPLIIEALGSHGLDWASPTLRLQVALAARILSQDAALYGDLIALNRHVPSAIDALMNALAELRQAIGKGPDAVESLFQQAENRTRVLTRGLVDEADRALGG